MKKTSEKGQHKVCKIVKFDEKLDSNNATCILADYLELANDKKICGLGVVVVRNDGSSTFSWSIDQPMNIDTMIGAIERLKTDFMLERGDPYA